MEVGSLVICIATTDNFWYDGVLYECPVIGKIYTIDDIDDSINSGNICITVCEINNPPMIYDGETFDCGFPIQDFRELMPPTSISIDEILKQEIEA